MKPDIPVNHKNNISANPGGQLVSQGNAASQETCWIYSFVFETGVYFVPFSLFLLLYSRYSLVIFTRCFFLPSGLYHFIHIKCETNFAWNRNTFVTHIATFTFTCCCCILFIYLHFMSVEVHGNQSSEKPEIAGTTRKNNNRNCGKDDWEYEDFETFWILIDRKTFKNTFISCCCHLEREMEMI